MVIKAYPNTLPVPLGTTVLLECRISGDSSTVNYQWSCPNGACDISSESRVTPRSRIVNGNTLTVNVVSESDGGEYRCTVTEGGNTQTSSYNITVSGMYNTFNYLRIRLITYFCIIVCRYACATVYIISQYKHDVMQ